MIILIWNKIKIIWSVVSQRDRKMTRARPILYKRQNKKVRHTKPIFNSISSAGTAKPEEKKKQQSTTVLASDECRKKIRNNTINRDWGNQRIMDYRNSQPETNDSTRLNSTQLDPSKVYEEQTEKKYWKKQCASVQRSPENRLAGITKYIDWYAEW